MNKKNLFVFVAVICSILASSTDVMALKNGLGRTPPMGFNTWNYFGSANSSGHGYLSDTLMIQIATAFHTKGMDTVGYQFVNLDDGYCLPNRDNKGGLVADPKWFSKGLKALADSIHKRGLKFGLYTDVGTITCALCYGNSGFPGLQGHEQQDCDTFVAWGVDYVKVDFCCYTAANSTVAAATYAKIRDCLANAVTIMKPTVPTAHSLFFSICNWGNFGPWDWGDTIGNMWRTTTDINNTWGTVLSNSDNSQSHYDKSRIGAWNDPDMLEVGYGDFATNYARARAHFSLWCIEAAPLIAGNDVRNMNTSIQSILINKDAIGIDQDSLGGDTTMGIIQGRRIVSGNSEVWVKLLKHKTVGSEYAVLFFNRGNSGAVTIPVTTAQIASLGGDIATGKKYNVRDVWGAANLADWTAGGTYTSPSIPVNDVYMIRLSVPPVSSVVPLASVKVSNINVRSEGERVVVHALKSGLLSVKLVNLKGEVIYSQLLSGSTDCSISTKSLPRGMYIINVQNAMERFEQKVFLQ